MAVTEQRERIRTRVRQAALSLACSMVACCMPVTAASATTANWTQSNLDLWFYTNASSAGLRQHAPSFQNALEVNESTQQFEPMAVNNPARLGSSLVAFNTSTQITPGLPAYRYSITSVKVTATTTYDGDPNKLIYDNQPISAAEILAEITSGNVTTKRPMELYGVGFRGGYTGFEFSGATSGPPLVDEITHPFSAGGGYIAYPIVGSPSPSGGYVDVMNSVTGGYSETAPGHMTQPFSSTPWAIGTTTNLTPISGGENEIQDNAHFTFDVNLDAPSVRSYLQQSLASGSLGFFISSLHYTGELGAGGGYPRWYMKEAANFPIFAPADRLPQLSIEYQILPPQPPGDYNGNGTVDAADYVLWRKGGPLANQVDDPDNVNLQDYIEWRARFGNTAGSGSGLGANGSIPEPGSAALALFVLFFVTRNNVRRMR